ncbi:hypothetical protein BH09SUM1_BH09SUM1_11670 [soil metagenome]
MAMTEKNKQALMVGGILGGAIFIIIVYFGLMSVYPGLKEMREQTEKSQTAAKDARKKVADYQALLQDKQRYELVMEKFRQVSSRLPAKQDPVDVFDLLKGFFEGTDVLFSYLEPGRATKRGRYLEYPFVIRGTARYHEFGQLVNLIECNPDRLMHVATFQLANNDKRPSIHAMEVGISTFTFDIK